MKALLLFVHLLYSHECCEGQHCHPVPCNEIADIGDGWRWHDRTFSRTMLRLSPDGDCHVCTSVLPLCIYLPPRA